jgi:glycerol uptake facilitator protein
MPIEEYRMPPYLAEFFGTGVLVLLGDGCVANNVLSRTKGHNSGWIVIVAGWGLAVYIPAALFGRAGGGLFNPALALGYAVAGKWGGGLNGWSDVPFYILAQMAGGLFGAMLVWLFYKDHFDATRDPGTKLAVFCTGPAIRNLPMNLTCEIIATFFLAFFLFAPNPHGEWFVYAVIMMLGAGLGGATGYAINPARDLAPRIAHALLPIKDKGPSDWGYAWIPVAGPFIGGALGAAAGRIVF